MASPDESDGPEMLDFEDFKERYRKVPVEEYPNNVLESVPEPMVSIHVSTYQHADFIRDCLEGVLMQETDFPMEIIIGEDESDDGTREICKEYADRYPEQIRLFLHSRENNISILGQPTGRFQFLYSHFVARGKYIAICEGDDYWTDPNKIKEQVQLLEDNPEYVLSHHDARVEDKEGNELSTSKLPDGNKKDFSRNDLLRGPFLLTLSLCFENCIDRYPSFITEVINADKLLISFLGTYGGAKFVEGLNGAVYRSHKDSMWSSKSYLFKERSHFETFHELEKYYKLKEKLKVARFFEGKKEKSEKNICKGLILEGKYKRAFKKTVSVSKKELIKSNYKSAILLVIFIIKIFAGKMYRKIS